MIHIERDKVLNIMMYISMYAAILLSMWAATGTLLALGDNFYILLYVDGYKPEVFTIKDLKFYKGHTSGFGRSSTTTSDSCQASGVINGKEEKFGLKGFIESTIQSQSDLEKEFSIGQKLQVLYNPNVPRKLDVHIQYPYKYFEKTHKRRRFQMIKVSYVPWIISFCIFLTLGIKTKSNLLIIIVTLTSLAFMGMGWGFVAFKLWL